MRGVPGSGKSTTARELAGDTGVICSADDFFVDENGNYNYDGSKIGKAHIWCQNKFYMSLSKGKTPVIVDNTNTTKKEFSSYIQTGIKFGYSVEIKYPDNKLWNACGEALSDPELTPENRNFIILRASELFAKRNVHGVPKETIVKMLDRFQF